MLPVVSEFAFRPDRVMLNHASFGAPSRAALLAAEAWRLRLEESAGMEFLADRDVLEGLLTDVLARLAPVARTGDLVCALTPGASSGMSALAASLPLGPGPVVLLADEYPSVVLAWRERARRDGRPFHVLSRDDSRALLSSPSPLLPGQVGVAVSSLVVSGTSEWRDLEGLGELVRSRGGRLVVDAAHGAGHLPSLDVGADALVASLHKWLPVPRSVGLLAVSEGLVEDVRPVVVGLEHESGRLVRRFSWPGTPDAAPVLALPTALEEWERWDAAGLFLQAAGLLASFEEPLAAAGARPLAPRSAPRMRSWLLPGVPLPDLALAARVRGLVVQASEDPAGSALRVAVNVWSEEADLLEVVSLVEHLLASSDPTS